jgi:hypothetical protein
MIKRFLITMGALLAAALPLMAQSLADVARAEEARRGTVKGRAKVYTNETLRGADGGDAPAPPTPAPAPEKTGTAAAPAPAAPARGASPQTAKPAASAADAAKDEKYWRDRLASVRDALQRSQTFAEALQSQINALYTEFVNMSDPAQRAVIEQKRLAAIAEQDRVKADIARHTKALAAIEDEGRRANVPAGWLR